MKKNADYYFNEAGMMVFTASFHLKRGFCCKNKCLHCPWKYGKVRKNDTQKKSN